MYGILGEEMTEDEQLAVLNKSMANKDWGYWCIDPLDGTNNYVAGLPFFAVSKSLLIAFISGTSKKSWPKKSGLN